MNGLGTHIWPVTSFQKLMLLLPKSETRGREATLFRVGVSQGRVKGKMEPTRLDPRPVSYTHLTLPTIVEWCRSRWSPYH